MTTPQNTHRTRAAIIGLISIGLLSLSLVFTGCGEGSPVGSGCAGDSDCGYGLQCFKPFEDATPICTIGCEESPCAQGVCIDTLHGFVCAGLCQDKVCREGLTCQGAETGEDVCWYADSNLDSFPEGVVIGRIEIEDDTNQDGVLNSGETATVKVYVDNIGQKKVAGLWAELDAVDEQIAVTDCQMPGYPIWQICSASCSCSQHAQSAIVSADPGEESDEAVLSMQIEASQIVEFKFEFALTIHDELGRAWERIVTVPIAEPVGAVFVASTEILWDSNGDGGVSPGEGGTLAVHVKNGGETQVRGLWTRLASMDPNVVVTACYAGVGSSWVACDAACSCEAVVESAKQTLEPMGTSDTPLFRMDFEVSEDAPVGPLLLGLEFRDELQAHWVDTVAINLVPPTATLEVIHTELLNDANGDGYLSPAESAMIQVFTQNTGITKAVDVWAELVGTSDVVEVEECLVGVGDGWNSCGKFCSCENALESAKQQLEPGESLDVAIFAVKFKLSDDAPLEPVNFHLLLHDGLGNDWEGTASVDVLSPNSLVQIDTVSLLDDSNGDGFVSPAEDVTIEIRAKNVGTSKSLGVWAYLSEVTEWMTVQSCYAATEGSFSKCDTECNCSEIPNNEKQVLDAGEAGTSALLQVNLHTSPDSPLEPIPFQITFGDAFGNVWTDTFSIEVVAINATIQVSSMDLWDDTNADGALSPGESAKVQIFAKNVGTSQTHGLWAELLTVDDTVSVSTCYSQVGATWAKCSGDCSCSDVSSLAKQVMEASSDGTEAILRINFALNLEAPVEPLTFNVRFHDAYGNTWDDSFIVDVEKYQADIQVGVSELSDDTNGDGWVSPGESAVLTVFPRNDGAVTALGVWAKLIAVDPVITINTCFVEAESTWVKCSNSCSCEGLFDSTLQDLPAASTSPVPILQIHYTVSIGAPTQPVGFGIGFTDGLGLEWTDAVVVDVVDADVDITVGVVEITDDETGDGAVSPGENVTISVYPQNIGTVLAMGLWARVDTMDEKFDMESCYARAGEAWGKCDNSCSCHNVFDNLKQDIDPGTTSQDAILQIKGTWTGEGNGAIFFPVTFTDEFQNQWTDSFLVEVEEAP